jgi:hypothetical protein
MEAVYQFGKAISAAVDVTVHHRPCRTTRRGYIPVVEDDQGPRRPDGVTDATVEAVGLVSEALEYVERARGALYSFHQLLGGADLKLGEACDRLREAGHGEVADRLELEVVGRNVLHGRWTFQIVEEFDDGYWSVFREHERRVRTELQGGQRHVFESEMKDRRRTHGHSGHERRPSE